MGGFRSALAIPLGVAKQGQSFGFIGLPWFRGGTTGALTTTTQPNRYGSGQYKEPAKLILSWLPKKKKKEDQVAVVENAIEQALAASVAPINADQVEVAARLLLEEYTLTELVQIRYADTLLRRVEQVMTEIDDEEIILLALN